MDVDGDVIAMEATSKAAEEPKKTVPQALYVPSPNHTHTHTPTRLPLPASKN